MLHLWGMNAAPQTLSHLRRLRGIQQKALAFDSGLGRTLLSKIENGRVNPSEDEVRRIAAGLSVTESEVLQCLKAQGMRIWKKRP